MERYTLNYQLFKRNNMKKYLSLVMIGLSLMLSGCNKDDNNDPDTPPTGDTGKVRYEATVSDPENFKLLIHYTVGVDISSEAPEEAAKETIVESPFTFEQEAKQGTYLWLSAYPIPKDEENLENLQLPKTVEVKIFIDDKLHKSNSGENYAMVQHIFASATAAYVVAAMTRAVSSARRSTARTSRSLPRAYALLASGWMPCAMPTNRALATNAKFATTP